MPALPDVPGVIRAFVSGELAGVTFGNVFHCGYTGATPTHDEISAFAADLFGHIHDTLYAHTSSTVHLTQLTVQDLSSPLGASDTIIGDQHGSGSATMAPLGTALVVSWKIGRHYRGGHPRTYLVGIPEDELFDYAHIATAYQTTINDDATAFRDFSGFPDADARLKGGPVCVHYRSGGSPLAVPLVDKITSNSVNTRLDSQRRRLGQ